MHQPPRFTPSIAVSALAAAHKPLIRQHLEALSGSDRQLRFGIPMNPSALRRYVDRIDFQRDALLGAWLGDTLAGFGHLVLASPPEFGLSLLGEARGRGLGTLLLAHAAGVARRHGAEQVVMHYQPDNRALARLAQRAGMQLTVSEGEGKAWLALPPLDPDTAADLTTREAIAAVDAALSTFPTGLTSA